MIVLDKYGTRSGAAMLDVGEGREGGGRGGGE